MKGQELSHETSSRTPVDEETTSAVDNMHLSIFTAIEASNNYSMRFLHRGVIYIVISRVTSYADVTAVRVTAQEPLYGHPGS